MVQRYGDVAGGAEAHARMLVNKLKPHFDVEVATTTALDYWTWENALTAGTQWVDGVAVHRFPVARTRARFFHSYERRAFAGGHSLEDELAFLDAQGPVTPELTEFLHRRGREYECVLFFTYIYWTTVFGLPVVPERAVLVPTAHDEPAIGLSMYRRVFHLPRAIAFNTLEERAMVQRRFADQRVPSEVVGVGVDAPASARPDRFREKHGIEGPFFLYLGRIVQSKGVDALFDLWSRWRKATATPATLVLAGHQEMPILDRADVRYVGQISDEDKWDAYAGCAAALVPEALQSLSLVALEAWSMGTPVVCPASSNVLASMSRRAGAGLPYRTSEELGEICELLIDKPGVRDALGRAGRDFVARTYTWPVVVEKYLDIFAEVRARNAPRAA
ncbi:MAG: glycosyltransferase family 4 protein [Chloroflexota bacterium]|nr:glycosyltransferase family 4 protein [Chloroflexota bacterium]